MKRDSRKKSLTLGLGMMVVFVVLLVLIFLPLFKGHNGLEYLDNLYNSISKGSAYYIPELRAAAKKFDGVAVKFDLEFSGPQTAQAAAGVLRSAGATAAATGDRVTGRGDLGRILSTCLADADRLFNYRARPGDKVGPELRRRGHVWWLTLKAAEKDRNRHKKFAQANFMMKVRLKAVECAYNYYGITPQSIGDQWFIVVLSLVFYVFYTIWFGYAVLYLLQGAGLKIEH
jgi:hypothetical protein